MYSMKRTINGVEVGFILGEVNQVNGVVFDTRSLAPETEEFIELYHIAHQMYVEVDHVIWVEQFLERGYHLHLDREPDSDYLAQIIDHIDASLQQGNWDIDRDDFIEARGLIKAELARRKEKEQRQQKKDVEKKERSRGFVYLIQSPTGAYKIGRTRNPQSRIRTFSVKLPFEVEYVHLIQTQDMLTLEKSLHERFEGKRVNGEWFQLAPEDVEYIKGLAS